MKKKLNAYANIRMFLLSLVTYRNKMKFKTDDIQNIFCIFLEDE